MTKTEEKKGRTLIMKQYICWLYEFMGFEVHEVSKVTSRGSRYVVKVLNEHEVGEKFKETPVVHKPKKSIDPTLDEFGERINPGKNYNEYVTEAKERGETM